LAPSGIDQFVEGAGHQRDRFVEALLHRLGLGLLAEFQPTLLAFGLGFALLAALGELALRCSTSWLGGEQALVAGHHPQRLE